MKTSNALIGISLAVLGGFLMGIIALNLYAPNIVALGAPGPSDPPNSALKSVTHNATLTGDGTTTAPLGIANGGVGTIQIANGAVSASKLGAASPSAGQLLSFNGTGLAWQSPSVSRVRVVDSLGHEVGPLLDTGSVIRQLGTFTFAVQVNKNGMTNTVVAFYHTTSDCSGPRYFWENGTGLVRGSYQRNEQTFYASDPIQPLTFLSHEYIVDGDPNQPGPCVPLNPTPAFGGLVASFNLSALGLTPPFHLEF